MEAQQKPLRLLQSLTPVEVLNLLTPSSRAEFSYPTAWHAEVEAAIDTVLSKKFAENGLDYHASKAASLKEGGH